MSNVLSEEKKQQVIALGKLGWPYGASSKPLVCVRNRQHLPESGGHRCMAAAAFLGKAHSGKPPNAVTDREAKPVKELITSIPER